MKTNTKKLNFREERLDGSTVTLKPGDIFTIEVGDCVANDIRFTLNNKYSGEEFFPFFIPNNLEAWKMLKRWNEVPGRKVEVHNVREETTVDFEDSEAYKYRFG